MRSTSKNQPFQLSETTIVDVVKLEKGTNKAVDIKEMELKTFRTLKSKTHYYRSYQLGFSQFNYKN